MNTAPTTSTPTPAPLGSTPTVRTPAPEGDLCSWCDRSAAWVITDQYGPETVCDAHGRKWWPGSFQGRPVTLRKPVYALVYAWTSNGGDHDLEMRGTPVKITADTVTISVVTVKGGETGILYTDRFPFLVGQRVTVARKDAILFR